MDNRKRRRMIVSRLSETLSSIGFRHHHGDYFSRPRGPLLDAFFFQLTRCNGQFTITYGIDAPKLLQSLRANKIFEVDSLTPSLWVSCNIDRLGPYGCKHEDQIANCGSKVKADIESNAIPWFNAIVTIHDFVEAYRQSEIHVDVPMTPLLPGVALKYGIYGMMLAESHDKNTSYKWLDAAEDGWKKASPATALQAEWVRIIKSAKDAL